MRSIPHGTDKALLKAIALPLTILAAAVLLYFLWNLLGLPSSGGMVETAQSYFQQYGLVMVFVSALLEGLLLVGMYYPGSLVIFLGVIFSIGNPLRAIETVAVVTAALFLAYCINYFLGKYGWYRLLFAFGLQQPLLEAERRFSAYGTRAIFLTYWHPNLAALTATAAGILMIPFSTFFVYSLLSAVMWNSFWGIVVYILGDTALSLMGLPFIVFFISIWIITILVKAVRERKKAGKEIETKEALTNF